MALKNKKSLGQHWLRDREILASIANSANLTVEDTVLEIGPGLGTLTSHLLKVAKKVVAVEFDQDLASKLPGQFPGKNLEVVCQDILDFDLNNLPVGYKVVANIPYYLTSQLIKKLMTAGNKPHKIVLLVQKEVAERLAAAPGEMSILAISAQLFAKVSLGQIVRAESFIPPPKVDSQVVILDTGPNLLPKDITEEAFFKVVKAGFSEKRKKLKSSLSAGLSLPKTEVVARLLALKISPDSRAEDLAISDWLKITQSLL